MRSFPASGLHCEAPLAFPLATRGEGGGSKFDAGTVELFKIVTRLSLVHDVGRHVMEALDALPLSAAEPLRRGFATAVLVASAIDHHLSSWAAVQDSIAPIALEFADCCDWLRTSARASYKRCACRCCSASAGSGSGP